MFTLHLFILHLRIFFAFASHLSGARRQGGGANQKAPTTLARNFDEGGGYEKGRGYPPPKTGLFEGLCAGLYCRLF